MTVRVDGPPGYRRLRDRKPVWLLICGLAAFGAEQLAAGVAVAIAYAHINRKRTH